MKKQLRSFLSGILLISLLLALAGCGSGGSNSDVFDRFSYGMTAEDVKAAMGTPSEVADDGDFLYKDVKLCGMVGNLEVRFGSDSAIYWVEWNYDTGDKTVSDYTAETQVIYDHFSEKYGEAEPYDRDSYNWYVYDTGGPRYMLSLSEKNLIRMFVDYDY